MTENAINLEKISKSFNLNKGGSIFNRLENIRSTEEKKILALDNVSFQVSKSEVFAIIGLNGSGKTTLLRTIAGIYYPDSGTVTVNGRLAPLLHLGTGFQGELPAKDNIIMSGMLLGLSKLEITKKIESIIEFAELQKFRSMKLKHYSSGMRLRLAFATSLQINPDIILMDEALAVGDKVFREKSFEAFKKFKENGKTIVFTTHNLGNLTNFCDRVLLIDEGKLIMIGNPKDVIERYDQITKKKSKNLQ